MTNHSKFILAIIAILFTIVGVSIGTVHANVPTFTADCDQAHLHLTNYNHGFTLSGSVLGFSGSQSFPGPTFDYVLKNPDRTHGYSYSVTIVSGASNHDGDAHYSGEVAGCPAPTTTAPTPTPTTTTTISLPTTTTTAPAATTTTAPAATPTTVDACATPPTDGSLTICGPADQSTVPVDNTTCIDNGNGTGTHYDGSACSLPAVVPPAPPAAPPAAAVRATTLPSTGTDTGATLAIALSLLVAGVGIVLITRRRKALQEIS